MHMRNGGCKLVPVRRAYYTKLDSYDQIRLSPEYHCICRELDAMNPEPTVAEACRFCSGDHFTWHIVQLYGSIPPGSVSRRSTTSTAGGGVVTAPLICLIETKPAE